MIPNMNAFDNQDRATYSSNVNIVLSNYVWWWGLVFSSSAVKWRNVLFSASFTISHGVAFLL